MNALQFRKYLKGLNADRRFLDHVKGQSLEQWWETCDKGSDMKWFLSRCKDASGYWISQRDILEIHEVYDEHGDPMFLKWVRENYELVDWD